MDVAVEIVVTAHVIERARERLGVPRRSVRRLVERAWREGATCRVGARFTGQASFGRQFANGIFIFVLEAGVASCTTVLYANIAAPDEEMLRRRCYSDDQNWGGDFRAARSRRLREGKGERMPR